MQPARIWFYVLQMSARQSAYNYGFTALFTWMSIVLVLATSAIYAWTYNYSSLTH